MLYRRGDRVDSVYFVTSGSMGLQFEAKNGSLHNLQYLAAPAHLGTHDVLEKSRRRTHRAVSLAADTTVAAISVRLFRTFIMGPVRHRSAATRLAGVSYW